MNNYYIEHLLHLGMTPLTFLNVKCKWVGSSTISYVIFMNHKRMPLLPLMQGIINSSFQDISLHFDKLHFGKSTSRYPLGHRLKTKKAIIFLSFFDFKPESAATTSSTLKLTKEEDIIF